MRGQKCDGLLPHARVDAGRTDEALRVRVHDEGPGFDARKVLQVDPTDPGFLLKPRGRGIFIMRSLMDEVQFDIREGVGCTAILTKYRKP